MEEVRYGTVLYCRVHFEAQISMSARFNNGRLARAPKIINQRIYVFEKCLSALSRSVNRYASLVKYENYKVRIL